MKVQALLACLLGLLVSEVIPQDLPSAYQYFTEGGISEGLTIGNREFLLNGKYIKILSGALHYYRAHPSQWQERLRQLRALGANTVETYVAWNIHEPQKDVFDFGSGSNDFSEFADIVKFVELAQEEDLLVILRPGPFICAEWDWGGFPSWLQTDPNLEIRQNYQPFLDRVKIYFDELLSRLAPYQFTRGGSIIMMQIENEYQAFSPRSREYLEFIRDVFNDNGFNESLHFTADWGFGEDGYQGGLPGVLQTANTHSADGIFEELLRIQPDFPLLAMEFYTGWFTHWFDSEPGGRTPQDYADNLENIIGPNWNASVNFYVYFGGTNFGFMSGANSDNNSPFMIYDVTSYDYDALVTEAGDYTEKYDLTYNLFEMYENPKLRKPLRPQVGRKTAYPTLSLQKSLNYSQLIDQIPSGHKVHLDGSQVAMEQLDINNGNGQSYGYIVYRLERELMSDDVVTVSWPRDFTQVLVDGEIIPTGLVDGNDPSEYWINSVKDIPLDMTSNVAETHVVDIMIENMGRVNYGGSGDLVQPKGLAPKLSGKLELNGMEVEGLDVIAMEFSNGWVKSIPENAWDNNTDVKAPCAFRSTFNIGSASDVTDTFLDMSDWHKGVVFVNGFNLGRYFKVGPQKTLYAPAALLKEGENEIVVFEQVKPANEIKFSDYPILG